MSETQEGKGSCLCGSIQITAPAMNRKVLACHCDMCRKWTGGPLLSVTCGTDVKFTGEEHIEVYNSSDWAERGFCKKCGSGLFYRLKKSQEYYMPIGLFDNCENITFEMQYFIDQKPEYYSFSNETKNMTTEEVFAEFGTPE
jgi:hypothetical protein